MYSEFVQFYNAIPDTLLIVNRQGEIVWANDRLQSLLGFSPMELIGQPLEQLLPEHLRKAHVALRDGYLSKPSTRPMGDLRIFYGQAKNGEQVPLDIELSPLQWQGEDCVLAVLRCQQRRLEHERLLRDSEERLRRSQEISRTGSWDWNIATGELIWTDEIYRIMGLSARQYDATYAGFVQMLHPQDRQLVLDAIDASINHDRPYHLEHRLCRPDGEVRHVLECGKVYRDREGRPLRMLGTAQDITDQVRQRVQQQLADAMFQYAYEGVLTTDEQFRVVAANPAISRLIGLSNAELLQQPLQQFKPKGCSFMRLRPLFRALRSKGSWHGELNIARHNAPDLPALVSIAEVADEALGQQRYYVITLSDISNIKQSEAQLEYLTNYDQLTLLPNRRLFMQQLAEALGKAGQASTALAVLYIDLDGFKAINDSQGHAAGDELLQQVAEQLRQLAGRQTHVARLGGDEFALLQLGADTAALQQMAQDILRRLSISRQYDGCRLEISASVGIAQYPQDGKVELELLRHADQSMHQAKAGGKNRLQFYDAEEGRRLVHRLQIISDLNEAIRQQQFELYYQPKLSLVDDGYVNVEALLRWRHPRRGFMSPLEFIPIAEDSGQILAIGEQVFRQVCQFIGQWRQQQAQGLKVAVNLSARQLQDAGLVASFARIMQQWQVSGEWLEFELTESLVMQDVDTSLKLLDQLKSLGASIAIDDFGTGYSSLSYLKRLPVDTLKIDRSFIRNLPQHSDDCAIAKAIITMAHELSLQVVAEGVETAEQFAFLTQHCCQQLQGFYIARPVAQQELAALVASKPGLLMQHCAN